MIVVFGTQGLLVGPVLTVGRLNNCPLTSLPPHPPSPSPADGQVVKVGERAVRTFLLENEKYDPYFLFSRDRESEGLHHLSPTNADALEERWLVLTERPTSRTRPQIKPAGKTDHRSSQGVPN
jgi:hypothetical protein